MARPFVGAGCATGSCRPWVGRPPSQRSLASLLVSPRSRSPGSFSSVRAGRISRSSRGPRFAPEPRSLSTSIAGYATAPSPGEGERRAADAADRSRNSQDRGRLIVDFERSLRRFCYRCGARAEDAGYQIQGLEAEHLLRRILAYENHAGATESDPENAVALIQRVNAFAEVRADGLWTGRFPFGEYSRERKLALEMVVKEEVERELLAREAAELTARWQEEEDRLSAQAIWRDRCAAPFRGGLAGGSVSGYTCVPSAPGSAMRARDLVRSIRQGMEERHGNGGVIAESRGDRA